MDSLLLVVLVGALVFVVVGRWEKRPSGPNNLPEDPDLAMQWLEELAKHQQEKRE